MSTSFYKIYGCLLMVVLVSCGKEKDTLFKKIDSVHFVNTLTPTDSLNAFTFTNFYNGGGVGIGDFNRDSLPDVYFAGNQVSSRLYLNEGDFNFKDITQSAGVGTDRWCTGVSIVDINQDGWDDIYISVAKHPSFKNSRNLLFVNQGTSVPTFKEEAHLYGLDYEGFTTQTAFFDYDLDGDLDAFLLNTAPDTQNPNNLRPAINDGTYPSTDRLFRNEGKDTNGQVNFTDVSQEAGIRYEGLGLGLVVADLNDDGYPDVYCSNDFISSDVLYLNNQDGTFRNVIQEATAHTSLYGMGVDAADLTNDQKVDILQMDMLPEDNFRQKQMLAGQDYDRKEMSISPRYNYQLQYMRNTLQVNVGTNPQTQEPEFSEMGLLAGLARTDWSWATLLADYDNDGRKDVFITNGYRKNITDRDFISYAEEYSFFGTDESRQKKRDELLNNVPEIKLRNYAFRNTADYQFENVSAAWGLDEATYSNGAAWADLDRDGDLDLIVNNIDSEASVYKNKTRETSDAHYLTIRPQGSASNPTGLGVSATVWVNGQAQRVENQVVRGYASSVEPGLHFGLGSAQKADSVLIRWPGGLVERLYNLTADQTLYPSIANAETEPKPSPDERHFFEPLAPKGLDYQHQESDFVDFKQTATLHKMLSRSGFALVTGYADRDSLEDVFVGGAYRGSPSKIYMQQRDGSFRAVDFPAPTDREVSSAVFLDADRDGDQDLLLVYGGNERPLSVQEAYQPQLYLNDGSGHYTVSAALPSLAVSASKAVALDYDQDGDMDLFIAGRQVPGRYPAPARSYLLRNDSQRGQTRFTDVSAREGQGIREPGLVCDVLTTNLNSDAYPDLLLIGEWMPVRMFLNEGGKRFVPYAEEQLAYTAGWWNCAVSTDLDGDGDPDFVLGNEGLNTFYSASPDRPIRIVGKDFNGDGTYDPVMGYYLGDKLYPAPPRDALNQQIIQFRKKYQKYGLYAKATFEDLFEEAELKDAWQAEATLLESMVLINEGSGRFTLKPLPRLAQQSPVFGIVPHDFNRDGHPDLMLSGNFYPNEVHMGRQDASRGLLLLGDGTGNFRSVSPDKSGLNIPGDARASRLIRTAGPWLLLTAVNSQGLVAHRLAGSGAP